MDYDVVYQSFYPRVLGFFLHSGVDRDVARDLTQTVFLRVWKNWKTIDGGTVDSLAPWIFTITRNLFLNHLRDGKSPRHRPRGAWVSIENPAEHEEPVAERMAAVEPNALEELLDKERRAHVEAAITHLPPRMRHCLRLYLGGFKYEEIACLLKVSIETVKSQLFQAKQKLKETLGSDLPRSEVPT